MTRALMSEDRVDREGRFFQARDVSLRSTPGPRPPVAVAATGPRGMEVAAEFADLGITQDVAQGRRVYAGTARAEVARPTALLDDACAARGRDPRTLPRLAVLGYGEKRPLDSLEAFRDCVGRYAELGITRIAVLWPRGVGASARLDLLEAAVAEFSVEPAS